MPWYRFVLMCVCGLALPVAAHEFWIEPEGYRVDNGAHIVAHFRNGEGFKGNRLAFLPSQYPEHEIVVGEARQPFSSTLGQRPAFDDAAPAEGMVTLAVTSSTQRIRYKTWEKFQAFVDHKDLGVTLDEHKAMGHPDSAFRESYRRFAKALVGVGHARGADQQLGLEIELVALANPYTADLSGGMPVQAFLGGAPLSDVQIELFQKNAEDDVRISLHRTDAEGIAVLPVARGHSYLVDTVHLRAAPAGSEADVVWETLWASLTFAVE